jgi:4-phytase / acid phosphatase
MLLWKRKISMAPTPTSGGWRFGLQQRFTNLPGGFRGLGLMANYSYNDSHISGLPGRDDSPSLMGTARHAFNIEPEYEYGRYSVHLGMSYNDSNIDAYQYFSTDSNQPGVCGNTNPNPTPGAPLNGPINGPCGDNYFYPHFQVDAQMGAGCIAAWAPGGRPQPEQRGLRLLQRQPAIHDAARVLQADLQREPGVELRPRKVSSGLERLLRRPAMGPPDTPACFLGAESLLRSGRMRGLTGLLCAFAILFCASIATPAPAQNVGGSGEKLRFAIYLSRHGVRSPTKKPAEYARFAASPWPEWPVQPGYLTPHGYELMKLFGAYDRVKLAGDGLLASTGCDDAAHVTNLADSDQRTRETGKALAEGLMPGCAVEVQALPEGTEDPLFHSMAAGVGHVDPALAVAAIGGRIGGDSNNPTQAYRPQLAALDRILAGCGKVPATNRARTSLFDVSAVLGTGKEDHGAEFRGPLASASTLSENLLLEYTQGMSGTDLGWGCLDEEGLREAMQLHEAEEDYADRTPAIARMRASNMLDRIVKALEQNVTGKLVAGAPGKPGDRVLFLVGHDTNIATVAGALGLNWIVDGRRDDTPPGGALVFELWQKTGTTEYSVRTYYTAQTLGQMRNATPLTPASAPERVAVFVPGCSGADAACSWSGFQAAVRAAIGPNSVR